LGKNNEPFKRRKRVMKKLLTCFLSLAFAVFLFSGSALAQEMSKEELIKELKALKERTRSLEEAPAIPEKAETSAIIEDEDVEDLEEYIKRIEFSGAIEVEASYEQIKPKVGEKEDSSDLTLATVDFAIDALITDRMRTHILFEYEDDEDFIVDEAIIHYQAKEVYVPDLSYNSPWYANIGRLTIPFGYFESLFISGPLTEDLGETKETAVIAGIYNPFINIAAGVYNGDIDKTGNSDRIESYVAACRFTLPEDISSNVGLMIGVSYISNIADSDELADFFDEELGTDEIIEYVAGFSSFLSVSLMNRFFFKAEYVGAVESFEEDKNFEPKAWNFEVAFIPIEDLEVAVRYGGSSDTLNFLPDTQVGICGIYEIFNNTYIGLEYLYEEFENDDEVVAITTQLAVEF
jgi:hypothetical protein